jgi:DNA-binding response OmpR family regulator
MKGSSCLWRFAPCRAVWCPVNPSKLDGRNVLIVEDEPLVTLEIGAACQRAGALVRIASNFEQALRLVAQRPPSVAILDYALGDFESTELYARLTQQRVPFVIYHGAYAIGSHSEMVIEKPAKPEVLIAAVELLRGSKPATTTPKASVLH